MPSFSLLLLPLLLSLLFLLLPSFTTAFVGGFYGREPPVEPVISSSKAQVVMGVSPDDNMVTMHLQLEYTTTTTTSTTDSSTTTNSSNSNSSGLSWILPVPVVPSRISTGSSLLLETLYNTTRPRFQLTLNPNGTLTEQTQQEQQLVVAEEEEQQPVAASKTLSTETTATTTSTSTTRQSNPNALPSGAMNFPGFPSTNMRPSTTTSNENSRGELFTTCPASALNQSHCVEQVGPTRGGGSGSSSSGFSSSSSLGLGFDLDLQQPNEQPSTVIEKGTIGIVDYVVVQGRGQQVLNLLQANGYYLYYENDNDNDHGNHNTTTTATTTTAQILDDYADKGYAFVAVKLQQQQQQESTSATTTTSEVVQQPIQIQYQIPSSNNNNNLQDHLLSLPLQLENVNANYNNTNNSNNNNNGTLQVYLLGDTRTMPVNYLQVTMEDAHVDWIGCWNDYDFQTGNNDQCFQDDYQRRVQQLSTTSTTTGPMFVTEYAGPSQPILRNAIVSYDDVQAFQQNLTSATTWLEFLTVLENNHIPETNTQLQQILKDFIPMTFAYDFPFQCAQWEDLYHPHPQYTPTMEDCYEIWNAPVDYSWDAPALYQALYDAVFAPAQEAQQWINQFSYLTRFYAYLDGTPVPQDPHFAYLNKKNDDATPIVDAKDVSHIHTATAVPICEQQQQQQQQQEQEEEQQVSIPTSLEMTITYNTTISSNANANDNNATTSIVFWQPAALSCPTWEKTSSTPVFMPGPEQPKPNQNARFFQLYSLVADHSLRQWPGNIMSVTDNANLTEALKDAQVQVTKYYQDLTASQYEYVNDDNDGNNEPAIIVAEGGGGGEEPLENEDASLLEENLRGSSVDDASSDASDSINPVATTAWYWRIVGMLSCCFVLLL